MRRYYYKPVPVRLSDGQGTILPPCSPDAVRYTQRDGRRGRVAEANGYIVPIIGGKTAAPAPFSLASPITAPHMGRCPLEFETLRVTISACMRSRRLSASEEECALGTDGAVCDIIEVSMRLEVAVTAGCRSKDRRCKAVFCGRFIYDPLRFIAEITQFNAEGDGQKKIFHDEDNIKCGGSGLIPSPSDVSFFNLFVNGALQPKQYFRVSAGRLEILTRDAPPEGCIVTLSCVSLYTVFDGGTTDAALCPPDRREFCDCTSPLPARNLHFFAYCRGARVFYEKDGIPGAGINYIPGVSEASYFNLYLNGVLQPRVTYRLGGGFIELLTPEVPSGGEILALEAVIIGRNRRLPFRAASCRFNAVSKQDKIFTDEDNIGCYGGCGIFAPSDTTFQQLFVNAMLQSPASYTAQTGRLTLNTRDAPIEGAPVVFSQVRVY